MSRTLPSGRWLTRLPPVRPLEQNSNGGWPQASPRPGHVHPVGKLGTASYPTGPASGAPQRRAAGRLEPKSLSLSLPALGFRAVRAHPPARERAAAVPCAERIFLVGGFSLSLSLLSTELGALSLSLLFHTVKLSLSLSLSFVRFMGGASSPTHALVGAHACCRGNCEALMRHKAIFANRSQSIHQQGKRPRTTRN